QRKVGEIKPDPRAAWSGFSGSSNNTLVVYQDYLIYQSASGSSVTLYVFDIKEDKWLDKPVSIAMDLFSDSRNNASLLLHASGTLYMAGTKAGDFVLYEVDFKVKEE